jgi:hypothetical protein
MATDSKEFINKLIRELARMTYIKPGTVPDIDLYMDQVTTFMEEHLNDAKRYSDDKILTKTMINNYAKNKLLPPPVKKKYSKDHMLILIYIYYFKNILSISDIQSLLGPLTEKFFDNANSEVSLEQIYKEVYHLARNEMPDVVKDISDKLSSSEKEFSNVSDPDERRFLQLFSFVCMLSYDVYCKKHVIESIIDEMNSLFPDEKGETNPKKSAAQKNPKA